MNRTQYLSLILNITNRPLIPMSCFRLPIFISILLSISTIILPARADRSFEQRAEGKHLLWRIAQNNQPIDGLQVPVGSVLNLVKQLNLSRDQIQRLRQLRKNSQGQNKERRQSLQRNKQELNQLIQGNGSSEQIRQKRQQVQSLQREIADINFEHKLAIREILTPEQRVMLQQIMEQRRQNALNSKY
jgi:periplasmic protein CpxP/Spy